MVPVLPLTRNVAPAAPVSVPPPRIEVPVTLVRLMQLPAVPLPLQEVVVRFAFSATPFARIAGAVCAPTPVALIELPAAVVILTVPPPARFIAVPFEVVSASVANVSVAPVFVPDHWIPLPPVPVWF